MVVSGGMAHRVNYTYGRFVFRVRTEADPTGTMSAASSRGPRSSPPSAYTEMDMYELGCAPEQHLPLQHVRALRQADSRSGTTHDSDPTQWHASR